VWDVWEYVQAQNALLWASAQRARVNMANGSGTDMPRWSTVISWIVAALASLAMVFFTRSLDTQAEIMRQAFDFQNQKLGRIQMDIQSNQELILTNQTVLTQHLLDHPDRELDKRITILEQGK